ncbi:MAG: tRNA pseudouridine 13 synthase (EC [uncultured Sulfurovum sp.]|uniref:tRNA pseudouridine synthase D n=1 Tax=uncultured Sulfurovum sp. TaxID=269237 RepID=A0A6S6UHA9_9BACT|nr:MAG: tRNA pseudouridine 13 synthase (EC [uncultured Sulfurovum sp.]
MNKTYAYNHDPIKFNFAQTIERFFVEEIPLFKFADKGANLILKIKKSDMSTFKLITVIAKASKLEQRDIGYAGLKDKNATTIQYISIPKQYERDVLKNLTTEKIEILEKFYSKFPIKVGQLKGNNFSIVLHKVTEDTKKAIEKVAKNMIENGIPNYYGYQRFGEDSKSYLQGKEIAHSGKKLKGAKEKLLVSAYQSYLYNTWLSERIKLSNIISKNKPEDAAKILEYPLDLVKILAKQKQFFKLFIGDDMQTYPFGKSYFLQNFDKALHEFQAHKSSPTGLLVGSKVHRSMADAKHLELPYDDNELYALKGDRRYAWIFPENLKLNYNEEKQTLTIEFYLPKGAYATTFLEEIGKFSLKPKVTRK